MKSFAFIALVLLSVAFCVEEDEASKYHKYREACTGLVTDTSSKFGQFIENTLKQENDSLLTVCKAEYFSTIPDTCNDDHYIEENVPSLINHMNTTLGENYETVKGLFDAMNKDDHIYDFATKCGSWDWASIGIMLLCCKYIIFYI